MSTTTETGWRDAYVRTAERLVAGAPEAGLILTAAPKLFEAADRAVEVALLERDRRERRLGSALRPRVVVTDGQ